MERKDLPSAYMLIALLASGRAAHPQRSRHLPEHCSYSGASIAILLVSLHRTAGGKKPHKLSGLSET